MALTLPVYNNFTPPISLQSHLRAMNFTCYYAIHDETEMNVLWQTTSNTKHHNYKNNDVRRSSSPLQLRRILLHSSLRLHGLARFFMMYPIFSFMVCTFVCFATCVAAMNVMLAGLALFVYVRLIRRKQSRKQGHKKSKVVGKHNKNIWNSTHDSFGGKYNYSNSSSSTSSSSNANDDSSWTDIIWKNNNDDSFDTSDSSNNSGGVDNTRNEKTKQKKKKQKKYKHTANFLLSHTDSFPQATSCN